MNIRAILFAVVCGAAGLALASPANAYTYTFINGTKQPLRQLWVHTVSNFCHDRNWSGNVAPGGQVNVSTASICLVDRIEVNGGRQRWSAATGQFGGTFLVLPDGVCFFSSTGAVLSAVAGPAIGAIVPGVGSIAGLGLTMANFRNSGCR